MAKRNFISINKKEQTKLLFFNNFLIKIFQISIMPYEYYGLYNRI